MTPAAAGRGGAPWRAAGEVVAAPPLLLLAASTALSCSLSIGRGGAWAAAGAAGKAVEGAAEGPVGRLAAAGKGAARMGMASRSAPRPARGFTATAGVCMKSLRLPEHSTWVCGRPLPAATAGVCWREAAAYRCAAVGDAGGDTRGGVLAATERAAADIARPQGVRRPASTVDVEHARFRAAAGVDGSVPHLLTLTAPPLRVPAAVGTSCTGACVCSATTGAKGAPIVC